MKKKRKKGGGGGEEKKNQNTTLQHNMHSIYDNRHKTAQAVIRLPVAAHCVD